MYTECFVLKVQDNYLVFGLRFVSILNRRRMVAFFKFLTMATSKMADKMTSNIADKMFKLKIDKYLVVFGFCYKSPF